MAEGRLQAEWDQTASLLFAVASIFRGKGRAPRFEDFHPFHKQTVTDAPIMTIKSGAEVHKLFKAWGLVRG